LIGRTIVNDNNLLAWPGPPQSRLQCVMANHHGGVVRVGEHIYGHSDPNGWVCQNLKTGEAAWQVKGDGRPGKGAVTCVAGRLLCFEEDTGFNPLLLPLPTRRWLQEVFELQEQAAWTYQIFA
jgi:hypothetical protein